MLEEVDLEKQKDSYQVKHLKSLFFSLFLFCKRVLSMFFIEKKRGSKHEFIQPYDLSLNGR
jgi:hypothetical protein